MKTLTKKQRGKIYLKLAAEYENKTVFWNGICLNILDEIGANTCAYVLEIFKEFELFSPDKENHYGKWFGGSEGNKDRITALLLCYEMTKA